MIDKRTINLPAYIYILKSLLIYLIVIAIYFLLFRKKILKEKIIIHVVIIQINILCYKTLFLL